MKETKQMKQIGKTVLVSVPNDDIAAKLSAWIEAWFLIKKYKDNQQIPWLMRTDTGDVWSKSLHSK